MISIVQILDLLNGMMTNVGGIVFLVLSTLLTALAALLGLGFGLRKVQQYITGKNEFEWGRDSNGQGFRWVDR